MRSRRAVLLMSGLLLSTVCGAAHAQESWTRYRNARYGTAIDYMEFFEPDPPPENGDGQAFTSPEATFRVFGRYNLDSETPQSYLAQLRADGAHPNVSLELVRGNRLTLSGVRGAAIYYESYIFSKRGVIHSFMLEYPSKHKSDYDAMVRRMARSFSGP